MEQQRLYVRSLVHPNDSVMDGNIATAMWFAARGRCKSLFSLFNYLLAHNSEAVCCSFWVSLCMCHLGVVDIDYVFVCLSVCVSVGVVLDTPVASFDDAVAAVSHYVPHSECYESHARIMLIGIGADEQLAG